jgi:hypothetical protein
LEVCEGLGKGIFGVLIKEVRAHQVTRLNWRISARVKRMEGNGGSCFRWRWRFQTSRARVGRRTVRRSVGWCAAHTSFTRLGLGVLGRIALVWSQVRTGHKLVACLMVLTLLLTEKNRIRRRESVRLGVTRTKERK